MSGQAEFRNLISAGWVVVRMSVTTTRQLAVFTNGKTMRIDHDDALHRTDFKTLGAWTFIRSGTIEAVLKGRKRRPIEKPVGYGRGRTQAAQRRKARLAS